jgi:AraC-like DNA-binding protein
MSEKNGHEEEEFRLERRTEVARKHALRDHRARQATQSGLELRAAGLTEGQIAEQLGMSQSERLALHQSCALETLGRAGRRQRRAGPADEALRVGSVEARHLGQRLKGDLGAVREAAKIIGMQSRIAGADARSRSSGTPPSRSGSTPPRLTAWSRRGWRRAAT